MQELPMRKIRFESQGAVAVITIDRAEVRNAVDGPTAAELADAFRRFDADDDLAVAVLTGAGGVFCAGADLKGIGEGRGNRVALDGDGPMGPTRMLLSKPTLAAVEGYAVAGGLELALVRSASRGAGRGFRGLLPAMGRAARRWRYGPPVAIAGAQPRPRSDSDRARRLRRRSALDGPGQPPGRARHSALGGDRPGE